MNLLYFTLQFLLLLTPATAANTSIDWLTERSQEEGVAPLGTSKNLFYKHVFVGWGTHYPLDAAPVSIMYKIINMHGDLIEETTTQTLGPVSELPLPVMRIAILHMVEGDDFELYVPPELGYGFSLPKGILPGEPFMVKMTMVDLWETEEKVWSLQCNLKTKENCSPRELMYTANIWDGMKGDIARMRNEVNYLIRYKEEGYIKDAADFTWLHNRMFLLPQLADLEEERMEKGEEDDLWQLRGHSGILPEYAEELDPELENKVVYRPSEEELEAERLAGYTLAEEL